MLLGLKWYSAAGLLGKIARAEGAFLEKTHLK